MSEYSADTEKKNMRKRIEHTGITPEDQVILCGVPEPARFCYRTAAQTDAYAMLAFARRDVDLMGCVRREADAK